jgi:hypothetical protein
MAWITPYEIVERLKRKYKHLTDDLTVHLLVARGIKGGCGHPKRFVRGVAHGRLEPEYITEPLDDVAYVDVWNASTENQPFEAKTYYNIEVDDAKFLDYVEDEGLLEWFGVAEPTVAEARAADVEVGPDGKRHLTKKLAEEFTVKYVADKEAAAEAFTIQGLELAAKEAGFVGGREFLRDASHQIQQGQVKRGRPRKFAKK